MCARYIGSLRRCDGIGFTLRGNRYGASVSSSRRSARNVPHEFAQVRAATFVADPAGDADMEVAVEVIEQLGFLAGETVDDRGADATTHVVHEAQEVGVRVALVQEQRLAAVDRELKLAFECEQLRLARREIAVVVETGLADRDDFVVRMQLAQQAFAVRVEVARVVRMHARRRVEETRMQASERERVPRSLRARSGDDELCDAVRARAREHIVEVVTKGFVREIGAYVNKLHAFALDQWRTRDYRKTVSAVTRLGMTSSPRFAHLRLVNRGARSLRLQSMHRDPPGAQ